MTLLQRKSTKIVFIIMAALLIITGVQFSGSTENAYADDHADDMRAVWISTTAGGDFPAVKGDAEAQKAQFSSILDKVKAAGINTVIVQVRPKSDALYKSDINPWSDALTGTQGKNPGYDPMAYMIEEAHKRGMSFHAWLNPYRVTTSGTDVNALASNHPARLHPGWVITHKNALCYNPALAEVRQYICDTVAEIVDNYDVDAIHFDDYFYPSGYPLPEGETRDGAAANQRREDINRMISDVYNTIKAHDASVLFGVSPFGIWKNVSSDPAGSNTSGNEGYYSVCADAKAWLEAGTLDYLAPQIYWQRGFAAADYETLVSWWSKLVSSTGNRAKLYIGQAAYRDVVAAEISAQLAINDSYQNVKGEIFFRATDLLNNRQGCTDSIKRYYETVDASKGTAVLPVQQPQTNTPVASSFSDVAPDSWYAASVKSAVDLGIINGMGDGTFAPQANLSVAQALTLAVKTYSLRTGKTFTPGSGEFWYHNAIDYAVTNGIINLGEFSDYNATISREDMAYLFSNALVGTQKKLNSNFTVPDISASRRQSEILSLYEKGILTGTGDDRAFNPYANITRAEAAAIINRAAVESARVAF